MPRLSLRPCLLLLLVLAAATSALGAEAPARVQVLPGGGAWVERLIPLPADDDAVAELSWELSPALVPRSVSARSGDRALDLRLEPPLAAGAAFVEGCLDQQVELLPAGTGGGLPAPQAAGARLIAVRGAEAQLELADGSVVAVRTARVRCHPARSSRAWSVRTASGGLPGSRGVRLSYLLGGWSWSAVHRLRLSEDMRSANWETGAELMVPEDLRFDEAQISLLEGEVPDALGGASGGPPSARGYEKVLTAARGAFDAAPETPRAEGVGELTVYHLDPLVRLAGRQQLLLTLRPAVEVTVRPRLAVSARSPFLSYGDGDLQRLDARLELRLENPDDVPRPEGVLIASRPDGEGRETVLGSVRVRRTAPGVELRVPLGAASGLDIRWRRTGLERVQNGPFRQRARVEIELANHREHAAHVVLRQEFGGAYRLEGAEPRPSETLGAAAVFELDLAPGASGRISLLVSGDPRRR